jgi:hypothetical protein
MKRVCHLFYVVTLCLLAFFDSTVYASSNPTTADNPCAAPNVRNDVRPDAGGPPTKVVVGIFMIDLQEISDVNQTLNGDFAVVQSWLDPRLSLMAGCEIALNEIWSPGLAFRNSGRKYTSLPKVVSIGPGGRVSYAQRYTGTFATYHHLHDFPFDKQNIRISLAPFGGLSEKDIQLVVEEKSSIRSEILNISDWTIGGVEETISNVYSSYYETYQSSYDFNITANRLKAFYVWKVILPLCLIVAMSWSVFWINPAQYGPQIGLSATSMLTLIAFIFATTNMVPKLAYLTLLDRFIVGSTILVFLALFESLTTIYLVSKEKHELARRTDIVSRFVFPAAFMGFGLFVFFL